jgi:hypothetical protein
MPNTRERRERDASYTKKFDTSKRRDIRVGLNKYLLIIDGYVIIKETNGTRWKITPEDFFKCPTVTEGYDVDFPRRRKDGTYAGIYPHGYRIVLKSQCTLVND